MKHSEWYRGFAPGYAGNDPKWAISCNVIETDETLRIPANYSLVVVDTLDVVGTLDNLGNLGVI